MVGGGRPFLREILALIDPPHHFRNADFQSISARSASAVTPSEKKFIYH